MLFEMSLGGFQHFKLHTAGCLSEILGCKQFMQFFFAVSEYVLEENQ
jgi:hypothetical protein